MRMCVACRQMRPKTELVRVVRTAEGAVIDRTGKQNGRGAYLCADPACLQKAIKTRALERALETGLDDAVRERLQEEITGAGPAV